MATSADVYNQMMTAQANLNKLGPASVTDISRDLMAKVGNLAPQYQELAGLESAAYAAPATLMNQYNQQYGQYGGYAPSAMQRMQSILSNIGQQYGTADILRNVINRIGGRIEQQAQGVYDQYGQMRDAAQQAYSNLVPIWQTMKSDEAAAAARAAQAKAAKDQLDYERQVYEALQKRYDTGQPTKTAAVSTVPYSALSGAAAGFGIPMTGITRTPTIPTAYSQTVVAPTAPTAPTSFFGKFLSGIKK